MTLAKTRHKKLPLEHRKRLGQHHRHSQHYIRTYWPYLPILVILSLGFVANNLPLQAHGVLGYATDMSTQNLLTDTNMQRTQNNESALQLNDKLDAAAQAKANDMAARDYWSHNTPDGQTPWSFITATGYQFQAAGENLAYGFSTASYTITGWMNSPEHRANILNATYTDVGFGFVNIPNYQDSGPQTLVVAMYAEPVGATLPNPVSNHLVPSTATIHKAPAPIPATTNTTAQPESKPNQVAVVTPSKQTPVQKATTTAEPKEQRIARLELASNNAPLDTFILSVLIVSGSTFLMIRHGMAWRKLVLQGEQIILKHPFLDMVAAAGLSLAIVASHTVGFIR